MRMEVARLVIGNNNECMVTYFERGVKQKGFCQDKHVKF